MEHPERLKRAAAVLAAAGLLTWAGNALLSILGGLVYGWNNARLAPSLAIVKGYELYYGPTEGPVLNTIYGPVTALAYVPAALAGTPTLAILIGCGLSALYYYGPMVLSLLSIPFRKPGREMLLPVAFSCLGLATVSSYPLNFSAHNIHADAPALGFLAVGCALLIGWKPGRSRRLIASAAFAVLAVWSKQTMVFGLVSIQVYVALAFGRRAWRTWFSSMLAWIGIAAALFSSLFGARGLLFNVVVLPSQHPFSSADIVWLAANTFRELMDEVWLEVLALLALATSFVVRGRSLPRLNEWLAEHRWAVFALVGVGNIPAAMLNRMKLGGDLNALSPAAYFLLVAVIGMLVQQAGKAGRSQSAAILARSVLYALSAVFVVRSASWLLLVPMATKKAAANQHEVGFRLIRERPGSVYLPNQPLSHLLAEGKLYHFSYGLYDRRIGGHPISPEHFRAGIPAAVQHVHIDPLWDGESVTRREIADYLPDLDAGEPVRPGWASFRKRRAPTSVQQ